MKRRFFLQGIGALTLSQVVAGCKQAVALTVEVLKGSVPAQVANKFRQQFGRGAVNFVPQTQLKDLEAHLKTISVRPNPLINTYLQTLGQGALQGGITAYELLRRPPIFFKDLLPFFPTLASFQVDDRRGVVCVGSERAARTGRPGPAREAAGDPAHAAPPV